MKLTAEKLARMMDLSAVRTDVHIDEIRQLAEACAKYRCICAFAMPCYVPEIACSRQKILISKPLKRWSLRQRLSEKTQSRLLRRAENIS